MIVVPSGVFLVVGALACVLDGRRRNSILALQVKKTVADALYSPTTLGGFEHENEIHILSH
jgi:hypothetical protein